MLIRLAKFYFCGFLFKVKSLLLSLKDLIVEYCYFCGVPFVNREHVPPRCFFPEKSKKDYRVNLIKVPSCLKHNSAKSSDDQYMLLLFSAMAKALSGDEGLLLNLQKSVRTIVRDLTWIPLLTDQLKIIPKSEELEPLPKTDWHAPENQVEIKPDYLRIGNFLAAVARGVLYHDEKVIWDGGVVVIPIFLVRIEADNRCFTDELSNMISSEHGAGDNKDIFYYEISKFTGAGAGAGAGAGVVPLFQVDMCFYSEFKASCFFFPRDKREFVMRSYTDVPQVIWNDVD